MRHVEVAAHHHGLLGGEAAQKLAERRLPVHAVVEPRKTVLRVGGVDVHKIKFLVFQRHHAPFGVVALYAQLVDYAQRLVAAEYRRARITLALGVGVVLLVALEVDFKLPGMHLNLLNTEKIGVRRLQNILEALAHHSAQAVNIPTYKFHLQFFCKYTTFPSIRHLSAQLPERKTPPWRGRRFSSILPAATTAVWRKPRGQADGA